MCPGRSAAASGRAQRKPEGGALQTRDRQKHRSQACADCVNLSAVPAAPGLGACGGPGSAVHHDAQPCADCINLSASRVALHCIRDTTESTVRNATLAVRLDELFGRYAIVAYAVCAALHYNSRDDACRHCK